MTLNLPRAFKPLSSFLGALAPRRRHSKFSLKLNVEGICMIITMVLIAWAAWNTSAPLLYLIFAMMCAFFVMSAFLATNTLRGLSVVRRVPRTWPAQQSVPVEILASNSKKLTASHGLRIVDFLVGGEISGAAFFQQVPPAAQPVVQQYHHRFVRRGIYHFSRLEVRTRFPFGLIERAISWEAPDEILILPQTIPVDSVMENAKSQLGDFESHRKGHGSGLYGLQPYTPEISARDIHWKISARRGTLIARQYEAEDRRRATVILNNKTSSSITEDAAQDFEKAIVLTASVIAWLSENGHEVELRTASGTVAFGSGEPHVNRCKRALAELENVNTASPSVGLRSEEPDVREFFIEYRGSGRPPAGAYLVSTSLLDAELAHTLGYAANVASGDSA